MRFWIPIFPVFAVIAGAMLAVLRPPGPRVTSAIQHFAAGLVFAAASAELLPDLKHQGHASWVLAGGAAGVLVMLGVREIGEHTGGALSLAVATAVDLLIDGLVLGMGVAAGERQAMLLAIALTVEVLFLGVSVCLAFADRIPSKGIRILATGAIALLLPAGAALGYPAGGLPPKMLAAIFAFALVALLYLVTEELLVEAHEVEEGPWITAMFFAGFLGLLLVDEMLDPAAS